MTCRPIGLRIAAGALLVAFSFGGCKADNPAKKTDSEALAGKRIQATDRTLTISVVGTNDLHGHVGRLAVFGGYLDNLRAAREAGGGGVVLLSGGDMFQGTLESNPNEGASVVRAYNALKYTAAAIGNHEFDYGPVGPNATPTEPGDDPQGALKARAAEASFPFLAANIVDADTGKTPEWKNVAPSTLVEVAGIKVGVIGVTTINTPRMTIATNIVGLSVTDLAAAIEREATALRTKGAAAVLVAAHAGARCREFHDPQNIESCSNGEVFEVARRLPSGLVDIIVGGHTHAGVAHRVNGIAIIESYAKGRAFGRADMTFRAGTLKNTTVFPPRSLCGDSNRRGDPCEPGNYEGAPVTEDRRVAAIVTEAETSAAEERARPLGGLAEDRIRRNYAAESALGNLFVDLMLAARPSASVALTNGGGLRADLPAGPITYGGLFEAMPFDNRFAFVTLTAAQFAKVVEYNLASSGGIFSVAGVEVRARCSRGKPKAEVYKNGKRLRASTSLKVVTSDFLATGGDGAFKALDLPSSAFELDSKETIRDAMAKELGKGHEPLRSERLVRSGQPRIRYPGKRPVSCR